MLAGCTRVVDALFYVVVIVLVLDVFLKLTKLMHQVSYLRDSIIVLEYSIEGAPTILILIFFEIT